MWGPHDTTYHGLQFEFAPFRCLAACILGSRPSESLLDTSATRMTGPMCGHWHVYSYRCAPVGSRRRSPAPFAHVACRVLPHRGHESDGSPARCCHDDDFYCEKIPEHATDFNSEDARISLDIYGGACKAVCRGLNQLIFSGVECIYAVCVCRCGNDL